jgi:hypothetical protein
MCSDPESSGGVVEGKLAEVTVGWADVAPHLDQADPLLFILGRVHPRLMSSTPLRLIINFAARSPDCFGI